MSHRVRTTRASLRAGAALALGLAAITPAAAQDAPMPGDAVLRFAGANTVGVGMIPPLANAWAKRLRLPPMRTEQAADPLEYTLRTEGAEGARKTAAPATRTRAPPRASSARAAAGTRRLTPPAPRRRARGARARAGRAGGRARSRHGR